ncbi:MAG TPA: hypothetical protein VF210_16270 [Pseudomonadales bacterium]
MKRLSCFLLLLIPMAASGGSPESIIGTWRLNLPRSVAEHMQLGWQTPPDCWGTEPASPDAAGVTLEITEDTLTWTSDDLGPVTSHTRVVGGNARLAIIETTNCEESPEQCERERRRAREQLRKAQRPGVDPFAEADAGAIGTAADAGDVNLSEAPASSTSSRPQTSADRLRRLGHAPTLRSCGRDGWCAWYHSTNSSAGIGRANA